MRFLRANYLGANRKDLRPKRIDDGGLAESVVHKIAYVKCILVGECVINTYGPEVFTDLLRWIVKGFCSTSTQFRTVRNWIIGIHDREHSLLQSGNGDSAEYAA